MSDEEKTANWRTYNLRLPPSIIADIDEIVERMNLHLEFGVVGRRFTRADAFRSALHNGIQALKATLTPLPPKEPTSKT